MSAKTKTETVQQPEPITDASGREYQAVPVDGKIFRVCFDWGVLEALDDVGLDFFATVASGKDMALGVAQVRALFDAAVHPDDRAAVNRLDLRGSTELVLAIYGAGRRGEEKN